MQGTDGVWQRGPWRWHLEATLNVPFLIRDEPILADAAIAAYTVVFPIGFGVHYVFGDR